MSGARNLYAIGVDIGGTTARSALVSAAGRIRRGSIVKHPVDNKGSKERILRDLTAPLARNLEQARAEGLEVIGIGIGMCGPLDYEKGISLIEGLDKYEAIYGVNLKKEFRKRLGLRKDFPVDFEVDAWSFARGEAWRGAGAGYSRVVALTLGTGFGSAFLIDEVATDEGPGVPKPFGWLGGMPYQGGLLDDVISKRGLIARYRSHAQDSKNYREDWDVKEIAEAARKGDAAARKTFREFGHLLGENIAPNLEEFGAECLVVGGRISGAINLFERDLKKELKSIKSLKRIAPAQSVDNSALWGAARMAFLNRV
ncbi:MAG: ROK family protein [Candidatus Omnitrophica bacterium]|nr:ROK family protein [Candidatus Omnitrophota bacterium]